MHGIIGSVSIIHTSQPRFSKIVAIKNIEDLGHLCHGIHTWSTYQHYAFLCAYRFLKAVKHFRQYSIIHTSFFKMLYFDEKGQI